MSEPHPEHRSPQLSPSPDAALPSSLPAVDGETSPPLSEADAERLRLMAFFQRLLALTPTPWASRALLVAIGGWYLVMAVAGVDVFSPNTQELITYGANFGPRTLAGQWWRLVSCMFIHIGLMHLALNLWALYFIGPLVERMLGHVGFVLLYFLSGTLASFTSVWFSPLVVSAGASGALFGLVGGLLGFLIRSRHSVPASAFRGLRNQLVIVIAVNIGLGFSIPGIDNAAHLGGLASGFVLGLILGQPIDDHTRVRRHGRNLLALAIGGGALGALILFAAPPAPPDVAGTVTEFIHNEQSYLKRAHELQQELVGERITSAQFAESLKRDVIQPYRRLHDALIEGRPHMRHLPEQQKNNYDRVLRYAAVRLKALQTLLEASQGGQWERIEKMLEYRRLMDEGNRLATEPEPGKADE